jgi:hypothetical protein
LGNRIVCTPKHTGPRAPGLLVHRSIPIPHQPQDFISQFGQSLHMGITRRRSTLFKLPSNVFSYRLGDRRTFQACTLLLIEGFDIGECPEFILQGA